VKTPIPAGSKSRVINGAVAALIAIAITEPDANMDTDFKNFDFNMFDLRSRSSRFNGIVYSSILCGVRKPAFIQFFDDFCGISADYAIPLRKTARNHRAGAHNRMRSEFNPGQYDRVHTDPNIVAENDRLPFRMFLYVVYIVVGCDNAHIGAT
jgi:hypothetical protein